MFMYLPSNSITYLYLYKLTTPYVYKLASKGISISFYQLISFVLLFSPTTLLSLLLLCRSIVFLVLFHNMLNKPHTLLIHKWLLGGWGILVLNDRCFDWNRKNNRFLRLLLPSRKVRKLMSNYSQFAKLIPLLVLPSESIISIIKIILQQKRL